jgi:hypothetical protein
MAAPVIGIDAVTVGTTIRVTLAPFANSRRFNFTPTIEGLFRVTQQGQVPLNKRDFRRIVSFNRRRFRSQVIANDSVNELITIQIKDPRQRSVYYRVVLPYDQVYGMSRLVFQEYPTLTETQEARRRNNLRTREAAQKMYMHPFDRFVPVRVR